MVTIKDIAREAGVSISSVSRYFNNRRLLGEESRNRIEAVVNKYCYTPNSMGRCLRLARSGKILVLLPTMENPMYLRILSSIENECYQYGLTVLACDTHNDSYKEKHLLSMLTNHYADGAILFSSSLSGDELNALSRKLPIVLCCEQREDTVAGSVSIDDRAAAFEAVEHLIRKGHSDIAMASGRGVYGSTALRERGYREALSKYGITFREDYIIRGDYGFKSGAAAAERVFTLEPEPTALFCVSDAVAIGAVRAAILRHKSLAVIGFDNTSISGIYMPEITSVAQPRTEMGKTAVEMLLARMDNIKLAQEKKFLPHKLVVRQSTENVIKS
ncbi:MAG: LacI family DNA-binding transcriptional regulator [Firmicutes bacterium]|nr:LacI family DNA-binding transcriptional regulator [Bacillota bacterium]